MEHENNKVIILGKKYIQKPTQSRSKSFNRLLPFMMLPALLGDASMYGGKKERQRPRVDILNEYELIQQKKSKLSKSNRDWVEYQFHLNFIEVN